MLVINKKIACIKRQNFLNFFNSSGATKAVALVALDISKALRNLRSDIWPY